jgi:hypothetical protein
MERNSPITTIAPERGNMERNSPITTIAPERGKNWKGTVPSQQLPLREARTGKEHSHHNYCPWERQELERNSPSQLLPLREARTGKEQSHHNYCPWERQELERNSPPSHLVSYMQSWPWDLADRHQDRADRAVCLSPCPPPPPPLQLNCVLTRTWVLITVTPTDAVGCRGGHRDLCRRMKYEHGLEGWAQRPL